MSEAEEPVQINNYEYRITCSLISKVKNRSSYDGRRKVLKHGARTFGPYQMIFVSTM